MNHFDKIALALPAAGLDGVLLTGEYNRFMPAALPPPAQTAWSW